jgi:hypothetical protein
MAHSGFNRSSDVLTAASLQAKGRIQAASTVRILTILLLAMALFAGQVLAQSTFGTFVGTVHDPSGGVVAGSIVTVTNNDTAAKRSTITDKEGNYVLVNLEPGTYQIAIEAPGFQATTFKAVELLSRQTARADGTLSVAGQVQAVNVNAESAPVITTEVSNVAETKTGAELLDLPIAIASRSLGSTSAISTLTTQSGVAVDNAGSLSVAGSKPAMLSVTIDGITTMNPRSSAAIAELFPSFGAIEEIHVSETNNSAEFGGISDITTVSKGGGNAYHGGVFENFQNSDLNARNPFSTSVTLVKMNNFGGYAGGHIIKNKLFFFGSYEALKLPRQQFFNESVPSLPLRNGDLSAYSGVITSVGGAPYAGNQIPQSQITPQAKAVLNLLFPVPNTGPVNAISNNYSVNFPTPISSNQEDGRIDYTISPRQTAFFRGTYKSRNITNPPVNTGTILSGPLLQPEIDYALVAAYNFIISSNTVNELRLGFTGTRIFTSDTANAQALDTAIGIPIPNAPAGDGRPTFTINGFQPTSSTSSSVARGRTLQAIDNFTWTKGSHTIKTGIDVRRIASYLSNGFGAGRNGAYTFNGSVTNSIIGNPYAAFLLGVPDKTAIDTVNQPDSKDHETHYGAYVQDDWKATSRLTINFGMRWEFHPAFYDDLSNVTIFLPNVYTTTANGTLVHGEVVYPDAGAYLLNTAFAQSIAPTPIVSASTAGIPQNLHYADRFDFAPRVGLAWRPFSDGKTVVRGGFGKYIETELSALVNAAACVHASFVGGFTNTLVNGVPQLTYATPFPANIAQPGVQTFQANTALNYHDPYALQWNLTIERDLGFNTGLRLSYEANHAAQLGLEENLAQIPANTIGYTAARLLSPYPLWQSMHTYVNAGRSNYDALTVAVNKRLSNGLQFNTSYVWAKNLSNGQGYNPTTFATEGGGQVTDSYNINLDYGNVSFTRSQRFLTTFLYNLPFGKNGMILKNANKLVDSVIGGWQLTGVFVAQTGPFMTVLAPGADPEGDGFPNVEATGRADMVAGANPVPANQSITNWINKAAFAIPPNNVGRGPTSPVGSVVGPGTQALSMALFKTVAVRENVHFQFGIAASNALNHPNYAIPNLTYGTAPFGTITNVQTQENSAPRSLQATARILF